MSKNWQPLIDAFNEVVLRVGDLQVTWEYIGEGVCGDFSADDPDDFPILRFSCHKADAAGEMQELPDSSYCTQMRIDSSLDNLVKGALTIVREIRDVNYKRRLEELSWMSPKDFVDI